MWTIHYRNGSIELAGEPRVSGNDMDVQFARTRYNGLHVYESQRFYLPRWADYQKNGINITRPDGTEYEPCRAS